MKKRLLLLVALFAAMTGAKAQTTDTSACFTYTLADLPFVEDFESYENNATSIPCWTMLAYSHPTYLRVEGGSWNKYLGLWPTSVSGPHFAVMPEMQDIPYLGMTFKKRSSALQVGVMTDPDDTLTFMPMASFGSDGGTWQDVSVDFSSCPITTGHIAFRAGSNGNYVEIDSIVVSQTLFDTCVQPDTIYVSDIQSDGATLHIVSSMASQHYMLYVAGDSVELFSNDYTITGLDDDSLYSIGVSSICADGSLTARTEVQFHTYSANILHVTGGNTSYTTEMVPIYGYFADYGFHSEMIYPASWIGSLADHILTGFTFYTAGSSTNANVSFSETFTMYLEEVPDTTYTSSQFKISDQAQLVWTGSVTITGGQWNITFDTPFEYNGGNLLVTVLCNGQTGGSSPRVYFNAYTLSDANLHPSAYGYASPIHQMPTNAQYCNYLPEMSIAYSSDFCHRPQVLAADSLGVHTAVLHWDIVSGATAYEWVLMAGGESVDSGLTVLSSLTFDSLSPSTMYQLYVRTVCDSANASTYKGCSFTTTCYSVITAAELPFAEDFEGYEDNATIIPCWTMLAYSRPEYLRVEDLWSKELVFWPESNNLPQFAVMPEMENISALHMAFKMRTAPTVYSNLHVGVMTDPQDTLTFVPIAFFDSISTDYGAFEEVVVDFASFTGTAGHIAFRAGMPPAAQRRYVEIDDIIVTLDQICPPIQSIAVVNVIDTAADLIIHDTASDDATYLVSVFHSLEDTVFQQAITDTTLTITELAPNTDYTVHVLKRCADGMEHAMVSATFHTPSASCLPVTELPWSETFDDCSTYVPDCWTALNMNSGNVCVVTGEILPDPNEHTLIAYGAHAPEMLLLLPEFALPMDSLLLSFDMMRYLYVDTIAGVEVGIVTDTADVSTFMPMATCIPNGDMVWERFQVTVPQVTSSRIALRFIIFDGPTYSAVIYVDNFTVEELSILPAPTNLQMLSVDSLTATVAWNAGGSESQWQLELTAPDTQTFSPSSNPTFTFTGLAPMTHYTVRVAAVDDDGTMSGWSLPLEFTTLDTTHTEGIACIEGNVDVTLYPNPAHTSVRVGVAEAADVTIIDMNGRTISTFRIHHSRHTVELESMARGTYMLRVVTAHGVAVRKLLVE